MTIIPFLIDNIVNVYNKAVRIKSDNTLEKDFEYPQDIVSISPSARKLIEENNKKEQIKRQGKVK